MNVKIKAAQAQLCEIVRGLREPVTLTRHGEPVAVLMSVAEFEALKCTYIASQPIRARLASWVQSATPR